MEGKSRKAEKERGLGPEPWEVISKLYGSVNVDKKGQAKSVDDITKKALSDMSARFPQFLERWKVAPAKGTLKAKAVSKGRAVLKQLREEPIAVIISDDSVLLKNIQEYLMLCAAFQLKVPPDILRSEEVAQAIREDDEGYIENLHADGGFQVWKDAFGEGGQGPYKVAKNNLLGVFIERAENDYPTVLMATYPLTYKDGDILQNGTDLVYRMLSGRWAILVKDYGYIWVFPDLDEEGKPKLAVEPVGYVEEPEEGLFDMEGI